MDTRERGKPAICTGLPFALFFAVLWEEDCNHPLLFALYLNNYVTHAILSMADTCRTPTGCQIAIASVCGLAVHEEQMSAEERLKNGGVLCSEGQWQVYLTWERGGVVMYGIQHSVLQRVLSEGGTPDYEIKLYDTLADALLDPMLQDHEWLERVPGH
jgi:hypothetical protein